MMSKEDSSPQHKRVFGRMIQKWDKTLPFNIYENEDEGVSTGRLRKIDRTTVTFCICLDSVIECLTLGDTSVMELELEPSDRM
jgi:hypothetical protein